eukprot:3270092-Pyramimonas_sp.AAC.1
MPTCCAWPDNRLQVNRCRRNCFALPMSVVVEFEHRFGMLDAAPRSTYAAPTPALHSCVLYSERYARPDIR